MRTALLELEPGTGIPCSFGQDRSIAVNLAPRQTLGGAAQGFTATCSERIVFR